MSSQEFEQKKSHDTTEGRIRPPLHCKHLQLELSLVESTTRRRSTRVSEDVVMMHVRLRDRRPTASPIVPVLLVLCRPLWPETFANSPSQDNGTWRFHHLGPERP